MMMRAQTLVRRLLDCSDVNPRIRPQILAVTLNGSETGFRMRHNDWANHRTRSSFAVKCLHNDEA
jgi:hypothetical protein